MEQDNDLDNPCEVLDDWWDNPYCYCDMCEQSDSTSTKEIYQDGCVLKVCEYCFDKAVKEEKTAEFLPVNTGEIMQKIQSDFCEDNKSLWENYLALEELSDNRKSVIILQENFCKEHSDKFNSYFQVYFQRVCDIFWVRNPYLMQPNYDLNKKLQEIEIK